MNQVLSQHKYEVFNVTTQYLYEEIVTKHTQSPESMPVMKVMSSFQMEFPSF